MTKARSKLGGDMLFLSRINCFSFPIKYVVFDIIIITRVFNKFYIISYVSNLTNLIGDDLIGKCL